MEDVSSNENIEDQEEFEDVSSNTEIPEHIPDLQYFRLNLHLPFTYQPFQRKRHEYIPYRH